MVSKSLIPRGIPYSTNVDNKIDAVNLECVSSSAWGAVSIQCMSDSNINNLLFGKEDYIFEKAK
jgi:hypothetical protein